MSDHRIMFSPPDITQAEIDEVVDALESGWITTGPKTKRFETELSAFMRTEKTAALNSATAALECALRVLGIGPGDEVITSSYTYTASASVICHVGATPVLCDTAPESYEMDYAALERLVNERTRAVIPVDIAGLMVDYERLFDALDARSSAWKPANDLQETFSRVPVIADAAHSLGACRHGKTTGETADFTAVSFHAVKNLTTAEGGALTWRPGTLDDEAMYDRIMLLSLHGQTKDALSKTRLSSWEYDVAFPGWKCNMTDIMASIGLAQLARYPDLLSRRRALVARYERNLAGSDVSLIRHYALDESKEREPATLTDDEAARLRAAEAASADGFASSGHLMLARLDGRSAAFRNAVIEKLADEGIAANVHYKPLPLMSAYRALGFDIADFPNALAQFENEITLPLHTLLADGDIDLVCDALLAAVSDLDRRGIA